MSLSSKSTSKTPEESCQEGILSPQTSLEWAWGSTDYHWPIKGVIVSAPLVTLMNNWSTYSEDQRAIALTRLDQFYNTKGSQILRSEKLRKKHNRKYLTTSEKSKLKKGWENIKRCFTALWRIACYSKMLVCKCQILIIKSFSPVYHIMPSEHTLYFKFCQ